MEGEGHFGGRWRREELYPSAFRGRGGGEGDVSAVWALLAAALSDALPNPNSFSLVQAPAALQPR